MAEPKVQHNGSSKSGIFHSDPIIQRIITAAELKKAGKDIIYVVAALMINEEDLENIVVAKNKETGLYELIGGKVNNEDLDYKEAIRRELVKELGINPLNIGNIFGTYQIAEVIKSNGQGKELVREFNVIYVLDYGELPEIPIDPKYSEIGNIHCLSFNSRNDLSVLTAKVCEDYAVRLKQHGYKFIEKS